MTYGDPNRTNNFNFLRLVFASLVIFSHTFQLIDGNRSREPLSILFGTLTFGQLAVDGFFLLSGYLIVQSWESRPNFFLFLTKRVLRIYPGFIVATLICAFVVGPLGADPIAYFAKLNMKSQFIGLPRLWGPITPPVFAGQPYPSVNGSLWTIPYEFMCYLAVLALGMIGLIKHKVGWLFITAMLFIALFLNRLGIHSSLYGHRIDFGTWSEYVRLSMFFFAGGSFYVVKKNIVFPTWAEALFCMILFLAMFGNATAEIALAGLGGYLMFRFAFAPIPQLRPFQTLPDVSYGLYLYGWPIQKLLIWHFPGLSAISVIIFSLLGGMFAGLLSWYAVEKPFLRLKPRNFRAVPDNAAAQAPLEAPRKAQRVG